jgi:MOSC domain-containing protein YiiM
MLILDSVSIGAAKPNPHKPVDATGIDKRPQTDPVQVRDPGTKHTGFGSGLVADFIGDTKHHGGCERARAGQKTMPTSAPSPPALRGLPPRG